MKTKHGVPPIVVTMQRRQCYSKGAAKVMKVRYIFMLISVLGLISLLFFTYFGGWIKDQSTVLKIHLDQISKFQNRTTRIPEKDCAVSRSEGTVGDGVEKATTLERWAPSVNAVQDPTKQRTPQKPPSFVLKRFVEPVSNLTALFVSNRTLVTDAIHELRRKTVADVCKKVYVSRHRHSLVRLVSRVYVEERHKLLYCEVPKAGCSNWKRVLMVLSGFASSPNNISHDFAHSSKGLRRLNSYNLREIYKLLISFTKVLFVRDPIERLVSAFRDKFEHFNGYYHPVFGKAILKKYRANASAEALRTGSGVTFSEFVRYLLDPSKPIGMDIHWEHVSKLCSPCLINYDFIGKYESLEEDANYLLKLTGAPHGLHFPRFKDRHSSDERTTPAMVKRYLDQITPAERQQLYNFYYLDYLIFNYSKPYL